MRSHSRSRRIRSGILATVLATALVATVGTTPRRTAAASSRRVDLDPPVFSDPTNITNPLFRVDLARAGDPTRCRRRRGVAPRDHAARETKTIEWDGRTDRSGRVAVRRVRRRRACSRSRSTSSPRPTTVPSGTSARTSTTTRTARSPTTTARGSPAATGRGGMIMPAHPHVGDVYRPENIPGLVFEEVTVKQTNVTVAGPSGPVHGRDQGAGTTAGRDARGQVLRARLRRVHRQRPGRRRVRRSRRRDSDRQTARSHAARARPDRRSAPARSSVPHRRHPSGDSRRSPMR